MREREREKKGGTLSGNHELTEREAAGSTAEPSFSCPCHSHSIGFTSRRLRSQRPVFILCGARSGSTLLRYILDSHPAIYSPPETNLASAYVAVLNSVRALYAPDHLEVLPEERAIEVCQALAEMTIGAATIASGATTWCDKSLVNMDSAISLSRLFPHARFICLYRNLRAFLVSACEATPFGLQGYGFDVYAHETPTNNIVALTRYWADRAEVGLAMEERLDDERTLHLTYEELVQNTDTVTKQLCGFLELDYDSKYFSDDRLFRPRVELAPGDYKIVHTTAIHRASLWRGAHLPLETLLPPPLYQRCSDVSDRLGYRITGETLGDGSGKDTSSAEWSVIDKAVKRLATLQGVRTSGWEPVQVCVDSDPARTRILVYRTGSLETQKDSVQPNVTIRISSEALAIVACDPAACGQLMRDGHISAVPNNPDVRDVDLASQLLRFVMSLSHYRVS